MGIFRALFRRRHLHDTLGNEVAHHIELQTAEYIRSGMSPAEAARAARLRFGDANTAVEECREHNRIALVETLFHDLRYAFRTFVSQPGFTAVILITLALGIGANTAVFSILRAMLLEPLPLPEPSRVVVLFENDRLRNSPRETASYPDYLDLRNSSTHFSHLASVQNMEPTLTGTGEPERIRAARVSASFFGVLGLKPTIGRVFGPGEDGIVLSDAIWERKFGRSQSVLGTSLKLDGFGGTVIGVLPPAANALNPRGAELWTSMENVRATQFRGQHTTNILGRLRPNSSLALAQAEVTGIMARLEREYPNDNLGRSATLYPLHEELAGRMRPALQALTAAVALLLLLACLNIANLLLARASSRSREMAIRVSIGAGRFRIARQLLTESFLLACAGAALGIAVAWWGVQGLKTLAPPGTPLIARASVDPTTLTATLFFTFAAWLVFGLLPSFRASNVAPASALGASVRNTSSAGSLRLRHTLVIAQIAMAAVLVISSGLLIRSFWRLSQVSLGYQPHGAISLRMNLPETRYPFPKWPIRRWPEVTAFHDRLRAATASIPGIESVSLALAGPTQSTSWTTRVTIVGRPVPPEGEQDEAQFRTADPQYLRATRIPLLLGRFFAESDDESHPLVAVVNQAFLNRHFPGELPASVLTRRFTIYGIPREIVGVVPDVRYGGPGSSPQPTMYVPIRQMPLPGITLIARAHTDPAALAQGLRQAIFTADPNVAPFDVITLDDSLAESTARERFILYLLTAFAALALALAAVGIYGVVAFSVSRREQEIALRMALGARARDVFSQVVGSTLIRSAVGISAGLALSLLAGDLLQPLVFQTSTRDLLTYSTVAAVLLITAFLGAAVPALRAARLDPAHTLRKE
jgi:predicted permease